MRSPGENTKPESASCKARPATDIWQPSALFGERPHSSDGSAFWNGQCGRRAGVLRRVQCHPHFYNSPAVRRASLSNSRTKRISRRYSSVYLPCFVLARRIRSNPSGVRGPVLGPPCNRHLPFGIAGALHAPPLLVRAPQRGADCARGRVIRQSGSHCAGLSFRGRLIWLPPSLLVPQGPTPVARTSQPLGRPVVLSPPQRPVAA